jgi:hypothetical protein
MPKDKARKSIRSKVKAKLASNGTVQRLREARKEIKKLREERAQLRPTPAPEQDFGSHPAGHTPPSEVAPE